MTAGPRELAYKDRFVWELEQTVSTIFDDCDGLTDRFVFPDMSTRVPMILYLSQTEFTTLYSAVLTGADLTYPNTSHDVENLFLQMVTCTMNQLCEALADCILNDSVVSEALNQWASENEIGTGAGNVDAPLGDEILEQDMMSPDQICNNDHIFGLSYAVVDAIHESTVEVLQAIELLTNPLEIASELGDNFPGAAILFSAADIAGWMQNTAAEAYDSAWSTVVRDELACLFFCAMQTDCNLSLARVKEQYLLASGAAPPMGESLEEWLFWLVNVVAPTPLSTVATISLMGVLAMEFGGRWGPFKVGIRSLATVVALAKDDEDSNWDILCTACPEEAVPTLTAPCVGSGVAGELFDLGNNRWQLNLHERPGVDWAGTLSRLGGGCFTLANVTDGRVSDPFHGWLTCLDVCDTGITHPPYSSDFKEFVWTASDIGFMQFDFLPSP